MIHMLVYTITMGQALWPLPILVCLSMRVDYDFNVIFAKIPQASDSPSL